MTKRRIISISIIVTFLIGAVIIGVMRQHSESFRAIIHERDTVSYVNTMEDMVMTLAETIDQERKQLQSTSSTREDYETFADELEPGFDAIESTYAQAHKEVLDTVEALYGLPSSTLIRNRIRTLDTYQEEMTQLFTYLLNYHYMTLEASMSLLDFNETTNEMTLYMASGHVTSVEYNTSLETLLKSYSDLLNTNSLQVFDTQRLDSQDERRELIERLENVKTEVTGLHTMNEADRFVNEHVFTMFHLLERSIRVLYEYSDELATLKYSDQVDRHVEDGALTFTKKYREHMTDIHAFFDSLEEQSVD